MNIDKVAEDMARDLGLEELAALGIVITEQAPELRKAS